VGGLELDVERILLLEPDLVVGIPGNAQRARLRLVADAGVPVLILPGSSVSDAVLTIETLGAVLDAEGAARARVAAMRTGLARLAASRPQEAKAPRIAFVYGWRPLYVAGPGSFPDELAALIGAENAIQRGGAWARYSYEGLVDADPDVILDGTSGVPGPPSALSPVSAVREGRVHPLPHPGLRRPGPRLVEGARALARVVLGSTRAGAPAPGPPP
jgi:iron complex transport system substrate-binding protein